MNARRDPEAPIFLVGFMGSGKSTVGRLLAARLNWPFEDTDAIVTRAEGRAIEEIFRTSGEGHFREAEWNALRSLEGRKSLVVATGGGLFLGVVQRAFVRAHGVSCWLDAPLSAVSARIPDDASRPLWGGEDPLQRRSFFERRRAAYALADVRIDASTGGADHLASLIESLKHSFCR